MKLRNAEIRFETTNRCNYKCKICPRDKMTRPQGTMDLKLFQKLIDEGVKIGLKYVTLASFGEPFLDNYFFDRVKYAKKYRLQIFTDTNGFCVDENCSEKLIESEFDSIRFSIFATTPSVYKVLHGVDGYNKVINNITYLLQEKKKKKSDYPAVGVYYIEQPENEHQTEEFIDLWKDKIDEISVWKAHNWISAYNFRKGKTIKKNCSRPISGPLQIRWNGDVVPCCFDYNNDMVIGNVCDGFQSLFNDERYKKIVDAHKKGDLSEYPLCMRCDQLYDIPDTLIYSSEKKNTFGKSGNTFIHI